MIQNQFDSFGLRAELLRNVRSQGWEIPTPIQTQAIPSGLAGKDVLGCAQTGTGKTAAFVLPILQHLLERPLDGGTPRVLILSPTRELASQIDQMIGALAKGCGVRHTVIFGGVGQGKQVAAIDRGLEILVATPGRLEDLMQQRRVTLRDVEILVLDEADRMLDEGFLPAVKRIVAQVPRERQTLFFSATMPPEVRPLADAMLRNPVRVAVAPVASTPDEVEQRVYFVSREQKRRVLSELLREATVTRAIIFTRTKRGADRVAKQLGQDRIDADAIHGNKSQPQRERALARFREGRSRVLVATDLAARGIDVQGISHVINYDLPDDAESYVHRIGRTARAGARGIALSLCSQEERPRLTRIERLIRRRVPVIVA